ncbi:response regulator transcription factor [Chloroflexota bacterium]
MKILIIEDSPEIIDIVAITLKLRWPSVELISSSLGKPGVELVKQELPDIILLDLGLPDVDGFQVLRWIRDFSNIPIVILTVREEETDKIKGLELGADDYIVKPFSPGELLARLNTVSRRFQTHETMIKGDNNLTLPTIKGRLRIDFTSQQVSVGSKLLKLGPRGYELLHLLVTNEAVVLSKQELMEKIFPEQKSDTRIVDVYIDKLREQLEENPNNPKMILNEGTTGYKFVG